jgi:hypothetical protein
MSRLDDLLNRVRLVMDHYSIAYTNDIKKFVKRKEIETYYLHASFGVVFIEVNLNTFEGTIQFNKMFQSIRPKSEVFDFTTGSPLLNKYQEAFLTDKEIFNAFVTQHDDDYTFKRTYGYLLDLLDVSLVFKVTADDTEINENDFIIRYNTLQSCSKMLMMDKVSYLQFENNYDFNYKDGKLIYDGDYKQIHQEVSNAYNLNDPELTFKDFKDLAQLTLMKIY